MSTNHTANYNLCQWVPSDKVLRVDFNEDNAKIDTALKTQANQISQALSTAGLAFGPDNLPFATGTYTGNNAETRIIHVGFRPRAVLLINNSLMWSEYSSSGGTAWYAGVAVDGSPASWTGLKPVVVTADGFQVGYIESVQGSNKSISILTNSSRHSYTYFAFR